MSEKHQFMLEQWRVYINKRIQSGMKVAEWCRQKRLRKDKYYYWLRELLPLITQQ